MSLNLDDMTWTCMVCADIRPDRFISVRTHYRDFHGVEVSEHIRYCNDRQECIQGSKTIHLLP